MDRPWFRNYDPRTPHALSYPDVTLGDFLAESARKYPYNTAINLVLSYLAGGRVAVGGKLTYRQLNDLVDRFAAALNEMGVRKGDRVALMLPNSLHFAIAFYAAMKIGAVIVNTNPTYTARELKHQLNDSGAETIVLLNIFWPTLSQIQHETPLKRVIVGQIFDMLSFPSRQLVRAKVRREKEWVDVPPAENVFQFEELLARYRPVLPKCDIAPDDIALFQYTGGTTGVPKAAMLSHRNLVVNTVQIDSWMVDGKAGAEKCTCVLPFFHVYGLTATLIHGVYLGAELVVVPNPRDTDHVMRTIQHERCTLFHSVPAMYIKIVNHPQIAKFDLHSVRICVSGSAPLPMEVQERFGQLTGGRLVEGYGLTETAPVTHVNPVYGTRKKGSIGIPMPDTDAGIMDLETSELLPFGTNQSGELVVRGAQVMHGYWHEPEETAATITADGWLRTGDICTVDADGYFTIVDRKKDMINVSGYKVLPRDVEEVLFTHPQVLEAAVVGIHNPQRGDDTVTAFVVLKPGATLSADAIKEFCRQNLAKFKVPREVVFRDDLPKTLVGKVLRRKLVEETQAQLKDAPHALAAEKAAP